MLVAVSWAGLAGCRQDAATTTDQPSSSSVDNPKLERDYFAVAIDFLKQRDEHNMEHRRGRPTTT